MMNYAFRLWFWDLLTFAHGVSEDAPPSSIATPRSDKGVLHLIIWIVSKIQNLFFDCFLGDSILQLENKQIFRKVTKCRVSKQSVGRTSNIAILQLSPFKLPMVRLSLMYSSMLSQVHFSDFLMKPKIILFLYSLKKLFWDSQTYFRFNMPNIFEVLLLWLLFPLPAFWIPQGTE